MAVKNVSMIDNKGQELLAMYGDDTHSLRPKIRYIFIIS
jgi:hypothetical protein